MRAHGDICELSDCYWPTKRLYIYIYVRLLTRLLTVRLRGVTRSERNNEDFHVSSYTSNFFFFKFKILLYIIWISGFWYTLEARKKRWSDSNSKDRGKNTDRIFANILKYRFESCEAWNNMSWLVLSRIRHSWG